MEKNVTNTNRAKFLCRDKQDTSVLWYEYRNHDYCVETNTEWPLSCQHKHEQEFIDNLIELDEKMSKYKGEPAEVGFQMFWDYLDN